jgi:hypothetical protein
VRRRAIFVVAKGEASLQIFLRRARWKGSCDVPAAGVGHRGAARREAPDARTASRPDEARSAAVASTSAAMKSHLHRAGRYRVGGSPEYRAWCSIAYRCENPRSSAWTCYGARGIRVCPEWRHSFETLLREVGRKPFGTRLERVNKAGHFTPGNVARPRAIGYSRAGTKRAHPKILKRLGSLTLQEGPEPGTHQTLGGTKMNSRPANQANQELPSNVKPVPTFPKQAVVVIHGMGEQMPMDTIKGFVPAVWETDAIVSANGLPNPAEVRSKPDERTGSLELRRITTRQSEL